MEYADPRTQRDSMDVITPRSVPGDDRLGNASLLRSRWNSQCGLSLRESSGDDLSLTRVVLGRDADRSAPTDDSGSLSDSEGGSSGTDGE